MPCTLSEEQMLSCEKQTTAKYTSRNTPPYDANNCKVGTSRKGNNGFMYVVSSPNVNGNKRWVKKQPCSGTRSRRPSRTSSLSRARRQAAQEARYRTSSLSRARRRAAQEARDRAAAWRPRPRNKAPRSRAQGRAAAAAWARANLPQGPFMPENWKHDFQSLETGTTGLGAG